MKELIVADTGPLQYLLQSGVIEILPKLANRVLIPGAVLREALDAAAPGELREWISQPPAWLKVQSMAPFQWRLPLGSGESEAIALAIKYRVDFILMDDQEGREAAFELGLPVTGTLGLIGIAAEKNLLDFSATLEKLRKTNIYLSEHLVQHLLAKYRS